MECREIRFAERQGLTLFGGYDTLFSGNKIRNICRLRITGYRRPWRHSEINRRYGALCAIRLTFECLFCQKRIAWRAEEPWQRDFVRQRQKTELRGWKIKMTTLLIMLLGMGAGRFFPVSQKRTNELVQLFFTLFLIFSMGVGLGQREDFFSELGVLGFQSLLFFLIPVICSVAVVYLLTKHFMLRNENDSVRPAGSRSSSRQSKGDPMMFLALGALIFGIACGALPALSAFLAPLTAHTQWILNLLMFSVGISVGLHKGILASLRQYHVKILVIPFGIIVGSLAGGVLCGLLLDYPVNEAVSVAGGLGWYSLAGVSVSSLAGAKLGSIAFLSNLLREIGSFFMIPSISRHFNSYTCIAPAAATSEDTTLPVLIRYTNEETVVFAVLNGIICSACVPVLLSLCY